MTISTCEDALITRIQQLLGTKVRMVDSLPGDFDDETLKRLLRSVPGVFVLWTGGPSNQAGALTAIDSAWIVYVITGHASGQAARRRGDAVQAGAYELIETLVPGLNEFDLAGEGSLSLLRVENLYNGAIDKQGVAVYSLTFGQLLTMPATVDPGTLDDFLTFDAQYDIPALETDAEHQKWLDGDYTTSKPDAEDQVTLPGP